MHTPEDAPLAVSINQLGFEWQSHLPVININELTIKQGEHVFLEGPSGSGKTTLLNLVSGVLSPTRGDVCVLGQSLAQLSNSKKDSFRADNLGIIFQQFNLLPYLSMRENVTLACQFSAARKARLKVQKQTPEQAAEALLSQLGLGVELFNRPVTALSVGQQQRVAAARALIGSPPIIIADEPTSALDAPLRDRFLELLFNACKQQQATLLFVSHDPSIAKGFERRIALQDINRAAQPLEAE